MHHASCRGEFIATPTLVSNASPGVYVNQPQVLDESAPRTVDCIHALRHALVDVIMITVFGLRPRAVDNFAAQVRDPICAAVRDIPIRLVVVRFSFPSTEHHPFG